MRSLFLVGLIAISPASAQTITLPPGTAVNSRIVQTIGECVTVREILLAENEQLKLKIVELEKKLVEKK